MLFFILIPSHKEILDALDAVYVRVIIWSFLKHLISAYNDTSNRNQHEKRRHGQLFTVAVKQNLTESND